MKQLIIIILSMLSCKANSQCNTEDLNRKKFYDFKNIRDRNMYIHVEVSMYNQLWLKSSKSATEMNVYIKENLKNGSPIRLNKYINELESYKKMLVKDKQYIDMFALDKLLYCYYGFVTSKYKKMGIALNQKNREKLIRDYQAATTELSEGVQDKYGSIVTEMKRLFNLYPID